MKYRLKDLKIDLGTTPIENVFINNYFSIASGDAIKVYIYAYKLAYENREAIDEKTIAEELGMKEEDVFEAIDYWLGQGVIKIHDEEIEILSLRELFLGIDHTDSEEPVQEAPSPLEEKPAKDEMANKEMFLIIEGLLNTNLVPNEIERILAHIDEFHQDKDLVINGFVYADQTQGKRNVNYVLSILRNWAIDGILTMNDFEKLQKEKEEKEAQANKPKERKPRKTKKEGSKLEFEKRESTNDITALLEAKMKDEIQKIMESDDESI